MHTHQQPQQTSSPLSSMITCALCKAVFFTHSSYLLHLQITHPEGAMAAKLLSSQLNTELNVVTSEAAESTTKSAASSLSEPLNLAVDHGTNNNSPFNVNCMNAAEVQKQQTLTCNSGENYFNHENRQEQIDGMNATQTAINCGLPPSNQSTPHDSANSVIDGVDISDYVKSNSSKLMACKYCKIIFCDRIVYHLHMGLHNVNNPWQCNMCGKACQDVYEFSSHVIHMGY